MSVSCDCYRGTEKGTICLFCSGRQGEPYTLGAQLVPQREGQWKVQGPMGWHQLLLLQDHVQPVRRDAPLSLLYRLQTQ